MVKSIQFWIVAAALCLAPLPFGSMNLPWVALWTAALSVAVLLGPPSALNRAQNRAVLIFGVICGACMLVAALQLIPLPFPAGDETWRGVRDLVDADVQSRFSSRAAVPAKTVGHFLLFANALLAGFWVATGRGLRRLLIFARYAIAAYALYAIMALVLTPNMVLWEVKVAYRGSLTGTFVNRNTAATFFGLGTILWLSSALAVKSEIPSFSPTILLSRTYEPAIAAFVARLAITVVCFVALILTNSRAGVVASVIGMATTAILVLGRQPSKSTLGVMIGAITVLTLIVLVNLSSIASRGFFDENRWRVYALSIEAIGRRPLLGTGAGTFAEVFPAWRTDDINGWGVWDFAHSTILEIAVEMGIPLTALIAFAAVALVVILVRSAWQGKDSRRPMLAAICGGMVLSYAHSLVDFSLQIPGYLVVASVLCGAGLGEALAVSRETRGADDRDFPALPQ